MVAMQTKIVTAVAGLRYQSMKMAVSNRSRPIAPSPHSTLSTLLTTAKWTGRFSDHHATGFEPISIHDTDKIPDCATATVFFLPAPPAQGWSQTRCHEAQVQTLFGQSQNSNAAPSTHGYPLLCLDIFVHEKMIHNTDSPPMVVQKLRP